MWPVNFFMSALYYPQLDERDVERTVAGVLLFGSRAQESSFPTCLHLSKVHLNKGLYCNINEQYQPVLTGCCWDCDHT